MPELLSEANSTDRVSSQERPNIRPVMRQHWAHVLFLHWPVPAAAIQTLLPEGLSVDTFDGTAWVGLVPFTMSGVRPVWSPPVPGLSHFHECNVRTYVHRNGQDPGVYFFSLDAANLLAVLIARARWRLPYYYARMRLERIGASLQYRSARYANAAARCHVRYTPTGTITSAEQETREFFLAERYFLYTASGGKLLRGQVHHLRYPLQSAAVHDLDETLIRAAGIARPDTSPLAHYARGVSVEIFPLQVL